MADLGCDDYLFYTDSADGVYIFFIFGFCHLYGYAKSKEADRDWNRAGSAISSGGVQ